MHDNTPLFARCTKAFFILLNHDGEKIKCCLSYAFTKCANAVHMTHSSTCMDVLAVL